jgi:CubicO group peptidase (beta-lactamase class C family)
MTLRKSEHRTMNASSDRRTLLKSSLGAGALLLLSNPLVSGTTAYAGSAAARTGFNPRRVAHIREAMQGWIDRGIIAGALTLLYRRGAIAQVDAMGWQDEAGRIPIRRDTIFRIASMTKPITCLAALMLIEEGKLRLNDPIGPWIPELAHPRVLLDPNGPLEQSRPASQPITVHHLFTHASGLSYPFAGDGPLKQRLSEFFIGVYGRFGQPVPPDRWMAELGSLPLAAEPGTTPLYGLSIDVLGILVSRVSGMPLEEFFAQRILAPLGMRDTAFVVPPEKKQRLAVGYAWDEASDRRVISDPVDTSILTRPLVFPSGGGGLVSTIDDYLQFCRLLLGRGEVDGKRIVSRAAADLLMQPASGPDFIAAAQPGMKMTLGGGAGVVVDPAARKSLLPEGSVLLGGAYGTGVCLVPSEELIALYMIQLHNGPAETLIRPTVPNLVMQALED